MLIGIEIGGTKLQLVGGDQAGNILHRRKLAVNPGRGASGIRDQIESELPTLLEQGPVTCIGIGFGGPVDWNQGRICRSHQIEGWSEFDLAGWIRKLSGVPARVDNDANVGALGEARNGGGKGRNPVFYVTLGSGVGGGLVVDGRIYHGMNPGEAEIGHVRLDRKGTTVESRCSGWAIDARIRELKQSDPSSLLCAMPAFGRGGEARYLAEGMEKADRAASGILSELAADLAFGLSHVVHLFHPEVIVLGGGLSAVGEPLRRAVARELSGLVMEAFAPGPEVTLAQLREDAVPTGALLLAAQ